MPSAGAEQDRHVVIGPGSARPLIDGAVMSDPHRPVRPADAALVVLAVLMVFTLSIGMLG